MKYNNFEKHISESFLHDSAAVDTDALIASLGIPVSMEPKKRAAWWMLTGLALLSLLVLGAYYFMNKSLKTTSVSDASESVANMVMNDNTNEAVTIVAEYDDESDKENSSDVGSINSEVIEKQGTRDMDKEASNVIENVTLAAATISNPNNNLASSPTNDDGIIVKANQTKNQNHSPVQYNTTDIVSLIESGSNASEKENVSFGKVNTDLAVRNDMLDVLAPLNILESVVVQEDDSPGLPEPECPSFSYRIPWNIALLAEVGVMKPMKDLNNVGSASSTFDLRENNENSKEAIQIGLHAKVSKGSNPLYVRGGAAYTRIAEQMTEEYDYIESDTTVGLISITTSMSGDTVTAIYGDVISETRFTGRSVKHYFLHLIDIPVAVGYELPIGGSFYAGAEVGLQFNLRTSGSGLIFRDINDYADLSEVTTKETKVGLSYFGGFHIGKHLSKRSSVQLSARFRYYPSRFSSVDPNIEQRYNLAGIHAGYVFRF